jgi:hypothetical protein
MTRIEDGADTPGSLLARTVTMLKEQERSYLHIYNETGLHPNWLSRLAVGAIKDPSVNRIQALYEYLAGAELEC